LTGIVIECYNKFDINCYRRGDILIRILKKIFGFGNQDRENIELIRKSKYFDKKYYLLENPDVKGDPCKHYYYYGWKEGKSPSFNFSNDFYLNNYKDVADAGINPLLHYLKFGKAENRLIEKDDGLSLKKVYEKIYECPYFYKIYISDDKTRRVNLFFDEIDDNIYNMGEFIQFVINFCNQFHYQLRIIYYMANFGVLKSFLKDNNVKLPSDVVFLNLKSSNYLEVGLEEKYVCTSWKNAKALLNTASINTNIYFYLGDYDEEDISSYYQLSNICTNDHIVCLVKDEEKLKKLKKCQLKCDINSKKLVEKEVNQLYCDFDGMFIVGVELLNDVFLTGMLDSNNWKVNILEKEKDFKFHLDTNVGICMIDKPIGGVDFIFQLSYEKKKIEEDIPMINAWIEKENFDGYNYINICKKNSVEKMNQISSYSSSKIDNYYTEFRNCIQKLKGDQ
jgi:hypothetical protein